ncbi:hypothetical protein FHX44_113225 [Pseudonocardia hierapolitana]|uniref:Uncharacterized protein n=1 Tax=Pseudonocardia hierapolitana TaxID=1128676 RepID=A0A561SR35_9PSEU|nr:hypothetical protein [Pseudonocardia hierapolitana]TWF77317.1 hypothetical protein FHX44_113225 [Pseudonocardia hierapolitana]
MSQSVPSGPEQPEPATAAEPEPAAEPDEEPGPLNRAARRAKAEKGEPTHVGPRGDLARRTRGGRPHTKRRH